MEVSLKQKALLLDMTKCTGCRGCQTACKQWHNLKAEKTEFFGGDGYQNPANLSSNTYTLVKFHEVVENNVFKNWAFMKLQCQHCLTPACVSACLVGALEKKGNGPVVWNSSKCIGCRYCMLACPYDVPKYQWDNINPEIRKCNLCFDRIDEKLEPSCAKTCPSDAILFGDRNALINIAEKRLFENPEKYHNHIYGQDEVGGTCILSISSIPLEDISYPKNLTTKPLTSRTSPTMNAITPTAIGIGAFLGLFAILVNRKNKIAREKNAGGSHD